MLELFSFLFLLSVIPVILVAVPIIVVFLIYWSK